MSIVSATTMQSLMDTVITGTMRKIMIWEANNEDCHDIQLGSKKIVEISDGWHIDTVYYPDKDWKDFNRLAIVIQRDTRETCEGCKYVADKTSYDRCRRCSRNCIDRYEKSEDE